MTIDDLLAIKAKERRRMVEHRGRIEADDEFALRHLLRVLADGREHKRTDLLRRTAIVHAARLDYLLDKIRDRLAVERRRLPRVRTGRPAEYYRLLRGPAPA